MKKDSSKIPSDQLTAYERWELPVMGGSPKKNQPPAPKLPTASELLAIQKTAYKEGFQEGKRAGTKAGFEQGHQQGLQAGMEEGLKLGTEQGESSAMAAKQAEIKQQMLQLGQLMDALQYPLKEVQEQAEEAIVNLVLAVSRAVVYRELQLDSKQMLNVVGEALAALPARDEQAIVYAHPKDIEFLRINLPAEQYFRYSADPALMAGGCRVETRHSILDFTVEKRFQTVVQQMLAGQSSQADRQDAHDFSGQMGEMSDFHRDVLESVAIADPYKPAGGEKLAENDQPAEKDQSAGNEQSDKRESDLTSPSKLRPTVVGDSENDTAISADSTATTGTIANTGTSARQNESPLPPLKSSAGGRDDG